MEGNYTPYSLDCSFGQGRDPKTKECTWLAPVAVVTSDKTNAECPTGYRKLAFAKLCEWEGKEDSLNPAKVRVAKNLAEDQAYVNLGRTS
jgi:hypothetical protein